LDRNTSTASGQFAGRKPQKQNMNYNLIAVVLILSVGVVIAAPRIPRFRHFFRVPEGWAGLLYRHGLYVRRNNAGRHLVWGCGWTMNLVDLRKTAQPVAAAEVLTADNVGVRLGLLVTHQVTEPARAAHETQHWPRDVAHSAERALRAVVAGVSVDALLNARLELGPQLLARVQPEAAKIGVDVLTIEVTEVTLPPELRRAGLTKTLSALADA
jgi:regulator of protease activity HflC (stomatin/prohibitin superfamily)